MQNLSNQKADSQLYSDEEVQQGIQELFSNEKFVNGMQAFLPKELSEHILTAKDNVKSIYDFQATITRPFLHGISKASITSLTQSGLEDLDKEEKYLFISNHRDIVLDSAFLNLLLFESGRTTSQIAIGDNLMKTRVSELLFRINKSFVVQRTGSPRELYASSIQLSKYIHQSISEKWDSVWIAQREGRAKDGNDLTQPGLLKMISLSGGKELKEHFKNLKIVPVAISYELDPTGLLKTQEYLNKLSNPDFKKSFKEDVNYMLLGMQGQKGKVHFSFGKPLLEELNIFDNAKNNKEQLELLLKMIDQSIHTSYQLHPINYVAHDLLSKNENYSDFYNTEERNQFIDFFEKQIKEISSEEQKVGRNYLLKMYANPVINSRKYSS